MEHSPLIGSFAAQQIIQWFWAIFAIYWLIAAFRQNRVQKREPGAQRLVHILFMFAGFVLLYSADPRFGALNRRFLPSSPLLDILAVVLAAVGVGFAIWARTSLGRYWSAQVTIRQEHRLIRTGPYKYIRHPIYTGMLLMLAGSVLVIGEYRAVLGLAVLLLGFVRKARKEESFLQIQFGPEFEEHKRQTGFFLPRFT